MTSDSKRVEWSSVETGDGRAAETGGGMLIPQNALRILRRRTGGTLSRATFYRWVSSGKIPSIRVGTRILIPWPALEDLIRKCYEGE